MHTTTVSHNKATELVNLHRHVEGVLTTSDLSHIAKQIFPQPYTTLPWELVQATHTAEKHPSFKNFLHRLPTRWMRRIILETIGKGISPERALRAMFTLILTKAANEGIRTIEFLACPLALTSDGDLIKTQKYWSDRTFPALPSDFTIEAYCRVFGDCVKTHPACVWAGEKKGASDCRMEVGLKFCIRREQEPESVLLTTEKGTLSKAGQKLAEQILKLYQKHDIVGVDAVGDENQKDRRLSQFRTFFQYVTHASVPFTVHAGELPKGAGDLAYDNLSFAIRHGASRIGHATRLFDDDPRFITLLSDALEKGIFFELNLTSNQWTGVAPDPKNHPIIRAIRREHPLFRNNPSLHAKLLNHITISDDDPAVFGESSTPLADEIEKVGKFTDNFGFDSKEKFLKHLKNVGQRAMRLTLGKQGSSLSRL